MTTSPHYRFFLGGADLEMVAVRALLARHAPGRFLDKGLAWGASVGAYLEEIRASLEAGETPVLIELADKTLPADAFDRARVVVVDHHGERAGMDRPSSLEQVFSLLGLDPERDWTRRLALIAANDKGHVRAMRTLGASDDEIRSIRRDDRRAQGVSEEDEAIVRRAIEAREVDGRLTLVDLAIERSSVVADLIDPVLGGPGCDQLLVTTPTQLGFYGAWRIVEALLERTDEVEDCWSGGGRPVHGFWGGVPRDGDRRERLIQLVRSHLA